MDEEEAASQAAQKPSSASDASENIGVSASNSTVGGDVTGRDKIAAGANVVQAEAGAAVSISTGLTPEQVTDLIDVILRNFSRVPVSQLADEVDNTLHQFRTYHEQLYEWKELHNILSEILRTFDVFRIQAERLQSSEELEDLWRAWQPVEQQVEIMLDWAKGIQHIGTPYQELPNRTEGEDWAVKINALRNDIKHNLRQSLTSTTERGFLHKLTRPQGSFLFSFRELISNFYNAIVTFLHRADKNLRDTASQLSNLSKGVLGDKGQ